MDAALAKPVEVKTLYKAVESAAQNLHSSAEHTEHTPEPTATVAPAAAPRASGDLSATSLADSEDVATHLRHTTGGNEKLIRSLAATFLTDAPKALARIRSAVAKKNAAELVSAAHLLKGSLAIFGAPKAVASARSLEALGRAGDLREAPAGLRALESEFALLQHELRVIHAAAKPKSQSPARTRATTKRPRAKK